jgi:hypothetical protein
MTLEQLMIEATEAIKDYPELLHSEVLISEASKSIRKYRFSESTSLGSGPGMEIHFMINYTMGDSSDEIEYLEE